MKIIKDKAIIDDSWTHYCGEGELPAGDIILSLEAWRENDFTGRKIGIQLEPDQHPGDIAADLNKFDLIAINFPTFHDGRGYSHARILRSRLGYERELRAVGDVMRDQLYYLQRAGFNSFEIKNGRDLEDALKAFDDFSIKYQVSSDEKIPLYLRR